LETLLPFGECHHMLFRLCFQPLASSTSSDSSREPSVAASRRDRRSDTIPPQQSFHDPTPLPNRRNVLSGSPVMSIDPHVRPFQAMRAAPWLPARHRQDLITRP
jgi:hypothetical protein